MSAIGCSRRTVDLRSRPCDAGQCLTGYTCDPASNRCVSSFDACADEGRHIPCSYGAASCSGGCRVCTGGTWSACAVPNEPQECDANTTACADAMHLATCGPVGYVDSTTPCDFGCNGTADPARCNECVPGTSQCQGVVFVECSNDGRIVTQQSCQGTSQCANVGSCDNNLGCQVLPTAPDNTPCDEGAARDGNMCNSACVTGQCVAGATADCDDGLGCTNDRCAPVGGCRHEAQPATFECRAAAAECDVAELCNGTASDCPADEVANASTVCRTAAGECDVTETCDGIGVACPTDGFASSATVCGASGDVCDIVDHCSGNSPTCVDTNHHGDFCGSACANIDTYVEYRCNQALCAAQPALGCDDGLACNGAETCNASPAVQCVADPSPPCVPDACACSVDSCTDPATCVHDFSGCSTFDLTAPSWTYARKSLVPLTLNADCAGQTITCTTNPEARLCLLYESFDGGLADFVGTGFAGAACGSSAGIGLDSTVLSNNCSGDVLSFTPGTGTLDTATLRDAAAVDATNLSSIAYHIKVGYDSSTDAGETVVLRGCCSATGACSDYAVGLPNGSDANGRDDWGDRPCDSSACTGTGYTMPAWPFDACPTLRADLRFVSSQSTEVAQVDDFAISAVGVHNLPVTDNSDGTYAVELRPCGPGNITVTCTWNVPGGTPLSDFVTINVP